MKSKGVGYKNITPSSKSAQIFLKVALHHVLSRIDKDAKEARNKRIFDLWLACWTQEEIAAKENVHEDTVNEIVSRISEDLPKSVKVLSDHADPDFQVPLYNIWKWQEKTSGSKHAGNSDPAGMSTFLPAYVMAGRYDIYSQS